jgi:signal peptidase I
MPGPWVSFLARSVLDWALRALFLGAVLVFTLLTVLPHLNVYRTVSVLSGSMRPTFGPGDLLLIQPEPMQELHVGQVITYQIPVQDRHVESHRVVRILRHGKSPIVWTKGDANNVRDQWTAQLHGKDVWTVAMSVPYAARPILWLRQPWAHRVTVLLFPVLLVAIGLSRIWRRPEPGPPDVPALSAAEAERECLAA